MIKVKTKKSDAETYASGLGVLVAPLVEIGEEAEEEDAVAADPPDEGLRVVAVDEEQLECVHDDGDELDLRRAHVNRRCEENEQRKQINKRFHNNWQQLSSVWRAGGRDRNGGESGMYRGRQLPLQSMRVQEPAETATTGCVRENLVVKTRAQGQGKARSRFRHRWKEGVIDKRDVAKNGGRTIWKAVRYFFHQMNFWYFGPMAATM